MDMEWISVDNAYPNDYQIVICYCGGRTIIRQCKDKQWFDEWGNSTMNFKSEEEKITHWMPLPDPPDGK